MSSHRSQHQTLPSIQHLINAADGIRHHDHYNPPMHDPNTPSRRVPSHPADQPRSGYTYPTLPNSGDYSSGGPVYPPQQQNPSGSAGGASPRRHVCTECGQTFDRPSSLQTHMNTHTGEQPYQCPYEGCGRRFSVKSNMRRHFSVHEQPRMTDAETEDSRNSRHMNSSCEYGVFSIAQHARR
ncbi:Zinc finger protein 42 OS=Mus musculus GN=Zfp42 PE=1 SV=1 [Rhizoctonia solani AG-1 IB]|uniref:Zinc finger protein 42 n=1 Tax=Thanatephorus cucumeris (strain AG1-IB / isolate 7/3/14) TaxID=1108050 RepID=A0A0B7FF38_THACB|nr:Zinc finger protein 42 OS=Mus musculus GN=Zfp42 PE=1 SV=1 [Rhizoctonia solani AG-1 IB]